MFRKALKYDMKSVWRLWWVIAASVLGLSVVSSVVLRFVIENIELETENVILNIITIFAMLFSIVSISAVIMSPVATSIITYFRFYKNFYTDEGYLTFTLPISRSKLFLAKTLNALIWNALHGAVLFVCLLIFALIAPPTFNGSLFNPVIFEGFGELIKLAFRDLNVLWLIVYIIEFIILMAASMFMSISLVHMCVTIGAIVAKKAKILVGIGVYYLVTTVFSGVLSVFGNFLATGLIGGFIELMQNASEAQIYAVIALILIMYAIAVAAIGFVFYFITLDRLEKRRNLA